MLASMGSFWLREYEIHPKKWESKEKSPKILVPKDTILRLLELLV